MSKYSIGGEFFSTKKEIRLFCRSIVANAVLDCPLTKYHIFLCDLIQRHPRKNQKIGCGIKYWLVLIHQEWQQRGLYIERLDNSLTDVSYNECISPTSHEQMVKNACRNAISKVVSEFKKNNYTESLGYSWDDCHVDHDQPTFSEIYKEWIKGKDIQKIEIAGLGDSETRDSFCDKNLMLDFVQFHNSIANLKLLHKSENIAKARKQ